ncbi:MAG: outer membrane beta-barrel protein [Ignavibacteria bacterium]|nr:outer membrane beta-barrel protein [Ignavibacteria bacterium]
MKKISFFLFSFILILFFNSIVLAQSVKVGVGGGLTNVQGPDRFTNDISQDGFGFSTEYNLGAIVKVDIPLIPITPRGFFLYHKLSGKEDATEFSQSISSLGLGLQYGFIPIPVGFDPYLFLDLTYNNFGDFTQTVNGVETMFDGSSRYGLQLGIGTEVTIVPFINLDLVAGYVWFNLTGKDDGEETISAITLDLFIIFNFI